MDEGAGAGSGDPPVLRPVWRSGDHLEVGELEHFDVNIRGMVALHDRFAGRVHRIAAPEGAGERGGEDGAAGARGRDQGRGGDAGEPGGGTGATGGTPPFAILSSLGGRGGGPGELLGGQGVAVLDDGSVAVLDPANFRVTLWGPDGQVVQLWSAPGMLSQGLATDGTRILLKVRAPGPVEVGAGVDTRLLFLLPGHAEPEATLSLLIRDLEWADHPRPDTLTCGPCTLAVGPGGLLALQHYLYRGGYRFSLVEPDGRVRGSVGRDGIPALSHTPESWARQLRARDHDWRELLRGFGLASLPDAPRPVPDPLPALPYLAYPHAAGFDGSGRLWVLRAAAEPDQATLEVHGADGRWLGERVVTPALTSIRVRGEWLVGRVEDALGEAELHLYRIVPEEGPFNHGTAPPSP